MKRSVFYNLFFILFFICQISYSETTMSRELKELDRAFKNSLYAVAKVLPFVGEKNVMYSNISYSFDSINGRVHYEASIEYGFRYGMSFDVMNTLVYSQEEAEYYFSFIQGALIFLDANSDIELISFTNNKNVEQYLWHKLEKTAYYVPVSSQKNPYLVFKIKLILRQKDSVSQYKAVLEDILKKAKWNRILSELM